MASIGELIKLFASGELGKLLAEKFKGERGLRRVMEDSDVQIVFKPGAEMPTVRMIQECVMLHFSSKGYVVEPKKVQPEGCFEAYVFYETKSGGFVNTTITTHYPAKDFEKGQPRLQVTSFAIS